MAAVTKGGPHPGEPLRTAVHQPGANTDRVVRSAGIMSAAVATSRVTGLVREIVLARLFGASMDFDAFRLGFQLPNLTRDLFAEGALSSAFVPLFTEYLTNRGKEEAQRLASLVMTAILIGIGALCLLGVALAPQLVDLFASGFALVPGKRELAIELTRIMFPFLLLVALAAQSMGILNACNLFGVPALASTMFNIGSVVFGLLLGFVLGPSLGVSKIHGMAYGVVLGGALQYFWQLPSVLRQGFRLRLAVDFSDPGLRHILRMMGPAILGSAAVQINVLVNTNFASFINDPLRGYNGPVSWLGWAFRFMQFPLGLFGVAIASATLPAISRSVASGDHEDFRQTLARSVGFVFLLTVPSSIGLIVLGRAMVAAIYQGGEFNDYDTKQTALALSCYAIGLAAYAALKVVTQAFYALKDSRTPMYVSLASIAINFCVAWGALHYTQLGHAGLALSTSAVALFNFAALFWILRQRIGGIYGRHLANSIGRMSVSALAMGVVVSLLNMAIEGQFGTGRGGSLLALGVCIPAGISVFYFVSKALGVPELTMAANSLAGPLRRLRGRA
ncbi:MAG: murein biosynthesis integral membrane protein MurJ [Acidobacteria bacterium]|nr:murein biosynthesis integral membrane protein MurJ [Acidobacteriota bacterium]